MGNFLSGFANSFVSGLEARSMREKLQLEIDERGERLEFDKTKHSDLMKQKRLEFEALEENRAGDLSIRSMGLGLEAERNAISAGGLAVDQAAEERANQERIDLNQHRARQEAFELKRIEIQKRQADVTVATALSTAFDPKTPKSARAFLLTQLSRELKVDPKSDQFKDLLKMVNGLEDENLGALKTSIAAMLPKASPGEITGFARSVFNGDTTIPQITEAMNSLQVQENREKITDKLATDSQPADKTEAIAEHRAKAEEFARAGMHEDSRIQLQLAREMEMGKETDPKVRGEIAAAEKAGELEAAKQQPLSPGIKRLLGFPDAKMTIAEAEAQGISTELLDPAQQKELFKQKGAFKDAAKQMDDLSGMVAGHPELIGSVGSIVRVVDSVLSQVSAIPELFEAVTTGSSDDFAKLKEVKDLVDRNMAGKSAVIKSRVSDLAYTIAKARDTGRLSNQDIERALAGIGESGSPEQFTAVLTDLKERLREGTGADIEAISGARPLDLMSEDQLNAYGKNVDNPGILRGILKELNSRGK